MGYPVFSAKGAEEEVTEASVENYPTVRLFRTRASTNEEPCTEDADCRAASFVDDVVRQYDKVGWANVADGAPMMCMTAEIAEGKNGNTKTINIPAGYVCPAKVSKENWLRGEASNEQFDITQSTDGMTVTATRTDLDAGWDLHLMISCCKGATKMSLAKAHGGVGGFSATCWQTGKILHNMLAARLGGAHSPNMHPIGLVDTSVGSTRIECWMDKEGLDACKPMYDQLNPVGFDHGSKQRLGGCSHLQKGVLASTFFNGIVDPLGKSMRAAAVVMSIGESNAFDYPAAYQCSSIKLAAGWRRAMTTAVEEDSDGTDAKSLPFIWLQLHPMGDSKRAGNEAFEFGEHSAIREAQRRASLSMPDSSLVVNIDLGEAMFDDKLGRVVLEKHPHPRQEIGRRVALALWHRLFESPEMEAAGPGQAVVQEQTSLLRPTSPFDFGGSLPLARVGVGAAMGGQPAAGPIVSTGPVFKSIKWDEQGTLKLSFDVADGLRWKESQTCAAWPEMAGQACCSAKTMVARLATWQSNDGLSPGNKPLQSNAGPALDLKYWTSATATVNEEGGLSVTIPAELTDAPTWLRLQYEIQPACVLANGVGLATSSILVPVPSRTGGSGTFPAPPVAQMTAAQSPPTQWHKSATGQWVHNEPENIAVDDKQTAAPLEEPDDFIIHHQQAGREEYQNTNDIPPPPRYSPESAPETEKTQAPTQHKSKSQLAVEERDAKRAQALRERDSGIRKSNVDQLLEEADKLSVEADIETDRLAASALSPEDDPANNGEAVMEPVMDPVTGLMEFREKI